MTRTEFLKIVCHTYQQEVSDMRAHMTLADLGAFTMVLSAVANAYRVELTEVRTRTETP